MALSIIRGHSVDGTVLKCVTTKKQILLEATEVLFRRVAPAHLLYDLRLDLPE